jgi:hypothetical protein
LPHILQIFSVNAIIIFRGDGGDDILSAVSFYSVAEVLQCTSVNISSQVRFDALNYCKG